MEKTVHSEQYHKLLKRLIRARRDAGVTQGMLAERLDVDQSFVSKCERGVRRIDVIELFAFCHALDVDPIHFITLLYNDYYR